MDRSGAARGADATEHGVQGLDGKVYTFQEFQEWYESVYLQALPPPQQQPLQQDAAP